MFSGSEDSSNLSRKECWAHFYLIGAGWSQFKGGFRRWPVEFINCHRHLTNKSSQKSPKTFFFSGASSIPTTFHEFLSHHSNIPPTCTHLADRLREPGSTSGTSFRSWGWWNPNELQWSPNMQKPSIGDFGFLTFLNYSIDSIVLKRTQRFFRCLGGGRRGKSTTRSFRLAPARGLTPRWWWLPTVLDVDHLIPLVHEVGPAKAALQRTWAYSTDQGGQIFWRILLLYALTTHF